jgi:kumamolisin
MQATARRVLLLCPLLFGVARIGTPWTAGPQGSVQVPVTDVASRPATKQTLASTTYQIQQAAAVPSAAVSVVIPLTDISHQSTDETILLSAPDAVKDPSKVIAHTNYIILASPILRPQSSNAGPRGETPASIRTIYAVPPNGGSKAIAMVDAFGYKTAAADLSVFSAQFKLPPLHNCPSSGVSQDPCIKIVYQGNTAPPAGSTSPMCDWAGETALDLQWAHAMAPNAKIILVEAQSDSMSDMFAAVDLAVQELLAAGGGELSLSWGSREFSSEVTLDTHLNKTGFVTFASSGDIGGLPLYPSVSPYVVSVGGTSLVRSAGNFEGEVGWSGSGGGPSDYEPKPQYQIGVENTPGNSRLTPDLAAVADPYTGVAVYDSSQCGSQSGWLVIGGTSLATPLVAGMANTANHFNQSSLTELLAIYLNRRDATRFRDITAGTAGRNKAAVGYDSVTGVGSPLDSEFDRGSANP